MKKYLYALAVVSLVLAGCSTATDQSSPNPTVTKTVTAYPEVEDSTVSGKSNSGGDEIYLMLVRASSPYADLFSDEELFDMGKNLCKKLDRGTTVREFVRDVVIEFGDDDDALDLISTIAGAGIAHYCPEYEYQLN